MLFKSLYVSCLLLVLYPMAHASVLSLEPYGHHTFPKYMYVNHASIQDDIFTNNSVQPLVTSFKVGIDSEQGVPKPGLTVISVPGPLSGIPACNINIALRTFELDSGKRCILRFQFNPTQPESIKPNEYLPYVQSIQLGNYATANDLVSVDAINTIAPNEQASLVANDNVVVLTPGKNTVINVHNPSQVEANNISVRIPQKLKQDGDVQVSLSPACAFLDPFNATGSGYRMCQITFMAKDHLPVHDLTDTIQIQGSNTSGLSLPIQINEPASYSVRVQEHPITQPSNNMNVMTVYNDSSFELTNLANTLNNHLPDGVQPISSGVDHLCGATLASGASCEYHYDIQPTAHQTEGAGAGAITYNINGGLGSQIVSIQIPKTTLSMSFGSSNQVNNEDIPVNTIGKLTISNTGKFAADDMRLTADNKAKAWFTITQSDCSKQMDPGATPCTEQYSATLPKDIAVDQGSISLTANNAEPITYNITPTEVFNVEPDKATTAHHLGYAAIRLVNQTVNDYQISQVHPYLVDHANEQTIQACDANASNCEDDVRFQSTCIAASTNGSIILAAHHGCYIWYRALPGKVEQDQQLKWQIAFNASAVKKHFTTNITTFRLNVDATAGTSLFVAGDFDYAGDRQTLAANIAQWDGTKWSAITSDLPRQQIIRALYYFHGDLYASGWFDMLDGSPGTLQIAKWNGDAWSELGQGVPKTLMNGVFSMANIGNDLYVGGQGIPLSGSSNAQCLIQWHLNDQGHGDWRLLQNSIFTQAREMPLITALHAFKNKLYVGGSFLGVDQLSSSNITAWQPDTQSWQAFGSSKQHSIEGIIYNFASPSPLNFGQTQSLGEASQL